MNKKILISVVAMGFGLIQSVNAEEKCIVDEIYFSTDNIRYVADGTNGEMFTGVNKCYWGDGKKKTLGRYQGGARDGVWQEWDKKGNRKIAMTYNNGMQGGETLIWRDKELVVRESWFQGMRNGASDYYDDGKIISSDNYLNGQEDGVSTQWYKEPHRILGKKSYKNGRLDGVSLNYYENGDIYYDALFSNGMVIGNCRVYDDEGNVKFSDTRDKNCQNYMMEDANNPALIALMKIMMEMQN